MSDARLVLAAAFKHMSSYFEDLSKKVQSSMPIEGILAEASTNLVAATVVSASNVKAEGDQAPLKTKKGKRKRDPDMPKRPPTAFLLHNRKYRSVLKAERPQEKVTMQALADHWKNETEEPEKEKLLAQAKELNTKYYQAMTVYRERKASEDSSTPALADEAKPTSTRKRKKRNRDPLEPKRPLSAYLAHNAKYRPILKQQHPEAKAKELFGLMGTHWKKLSDTERTQFKTDAKKRMDGHKILLAAYKNKKTNSQDAVVAGTPSVPPAKSDEKAVGTPSAHPAKSEKKRKRSKKKKKQQEKLTATPSAAATPAGSAKKRKRSKKKKKKQQQKLTATPTL